MAGAPRQYSGAVMDEYLEARRWQSALELLSLDFVRSVFEELGVDIRFEETLRGLVRDGLLGRFDQQTIPLVAQSPAQVILAHEQNLVPALDALGASLGKIQQIKLRHWVLYVHDSDHNPWVPYHETLSTWAQRIRRKQKDTIGLCGDVQKIALELREATNSKDIEDRLRMARSRQLSAWDQRLFAQRGLLELPPDSDYFPFVDEIELTVRMKRFQHYFGQMASGLSSHDRKAIEAAVRSVANESVEINNLP